MRWGRIAIIALLIGLPILASWVYRVWTSIPAKIVIAAGPADGRYLVVAHSLARALEQQYGIEVEVLETSGSLQNRQLIESGDADLALYQHGAGEDRPDRESTDGSALKSIGNVYSEVVHVIGRDGISLETPDDWRALRIAVGASDSGDYTTSLALLKHLNLTESDVDARHPTYPEMIEQLRAEGLDAAVVTMGLGAPALESLLGDPENPAARLHSIPFRDAFAANRRSAIPFEIPRGLYHTRAPAEPKEVIETIAFRAQLLIHGRSRVALSEAVTEVLLSERFQVDANLNELFKEGAEFARESPEFPLHRGAVNIYDPNLKPLLNSDFVESLEGLRSFIVSLVITGYVLFRWYRERRRRKQEHRMDRYIQRVLVIEQQQLDCDQVAGRDDTEKLQKLLDDVTQLRQDALGVFSAHEINEDRAVDCFIEMCHALSDKINAKLTRQRLDAGFRKLARMDE